MYIINECYEQKGSRIVDRTHDIPIPDQGIMILFAVIKKENEIEGALVKRFHLRCMLLLEDLTNVRSQQ